MTSNELLTLLSTKTNNTHYLNRYVNFISSRTDRILDGGVITETHHICPKASDLFPEYTNLSLHEWNSIQLTTREHIIAHVMLWKIFGGSQSFALDYFLNRFNDESADMPYQRKVPKSISIRYAARIREEVRSMRLGKGTYKDEQGNIIYLHRDDPRIEELGLVGFRSGIPHNDETKEKMSASKLLNRLVRLSFLDLTRSIPLFSDEYDDHIAQGWRPYVDVGTTVDHVDQEDLEYRDIIAYAKTSQSLSGRSDFMYPDGTFYGKLYKDDPAIAELGLMYYITEKRLESATNAQKLAVDYNTGTKWYNNGTENKKFKGVIPEGWVLGQIGISDEVKRVRGIETSKRVAGTQTYNDGIRNYRIKDGDFIDPSWKRGMAPQKKRKASHKIGKTAYTDGVKTYFIGPDDYIDPSWVPGTKKKNG